MVCLWILVTAVVWPVLVRNIFVLGGSFTTFIWMAVTGVICWLMGGLALRRRSRMMRAPVILAVGALGTFVFCWSGMLFWPLFLARHHAAYAREIAVSGPPGQRFVVWDVSDRDGMLFEPEQRLIYDETGRWVRCGRKWDALPRPDHDDVHAQALYCAYNCEHLMGSFWLCRSN